MTCLAFDWPTTPPTGLARTMDATFLNLVANHQDVRDWLGGDGPLDLTALIADPENLAATTGAGGFVAVAHGGARYEIHSLFLPEGRGRDAIAAMRHGLAYLFTSSDAVELVTKVPAENKAAAALAKLAGFQVLFTSAIPWRHGAVAPVDFMSLTLDQWVARSTTLAPLGTWLHARMEDTKKAFGSTLGAHSDDDDMHDRMAGLAMLMVRAGLPKKAEWIYNRWAAWTGFPPIRVVRESPTVIDLGGIVIEARSQDVEVLSCR